MSVPTSPKVIQQQLDDAMQNQQSLVQWLGTGGLEAVLSAMNQNTVYRGIMPFADTTSMSLAGGTDSRYAVCKNGSVGLNFYEYFENVDVTIAGGVLSLVGGQWRPIYASQNVLSGVWIEGAANKDIIPAIGYEDSAVAVGKTAAAQGLWMDFANTDSSGKGRGVKFPVLSTATINAKTLVPNEHFYNSEDKMLLRYDATEANTKSAGVYASSLSTLLAVASTGYTLTFAAAQHVSTYKVYVTATNDETAALLAGGFYITAKSTSNFRIAFINPPASDITLSLDYQISH